MSTVARKSFDTVATSLTLLGYALTETARGYCVHGPVVFCTPWWAKVALLLRLQAPK